MSIKNSCDWLAYVAVRIAIAVIQALPLSTCERCARIIAVGMHDIVRIRRKVVLENISKAFPEFSQEKCDAVARDMWVHLLLMVCEIAHAPRKLHISTWRKYATVVDRKGVIEAILSERPTVILSGHFGNFELGGYLLGVFGFPTHTIARNLDNPYLNRFVNDFRGAKGQYILPKDGSREAIADVLRNGGTITLLADQAAGPKGCWINFLGRPASTHKAIGVLPLSADALTIITSVRRLDKPLHLEVDLVGSVDPLSPDFKLGSVPLFAEWYTKCLEQMIRKTPEQYWWVHRRWKGEPSASAIRRMKSQQKSKAA